MSAQPHVRAPLPEPLLAKAGRHLRLYESAQILFPGFVGILSQRTLPALGVLVLYGVAYATHVLSVYSFNDLCDYETDSDNPRKKGARQKSVPWLRRQTVMLTGGFFVAVAFMPPPVRLLFVASQAICMAYSHPRVRLKRRLLGSEVAHFVAGASYFWSGVLVAGGDARAHTSGAVLFGLLYLSGGTFNEVMDRDADAKAHQRHLVVRIGHWRALALVMAVHYTAFVLLGLYARPVLPPLLAAAAAAVYTLAAARVWRAREDPDALLRFRSLYRLLFAALLLALSLGHLRALLARA